MTKTKAHYYRTHLKVVAADILEAARAKDFAEVEQQLTEFGRYLERHEEALAVND